jgi:hypothetical protein
MPGIINVTVVSMLFMMLFGIFFLQLLKGKFHYCEFPDNIREYIDQNDIITASDCINFGGSWVRKPINFDNILESMTTLFVMCTTEGWVNFMFDAVDSVGINKQPK